MPVMLHSYNRLLFLLLQRKGDVMIRRIAGLRTSSLLDMVFMLELGTGQLGLIKPVELRTLCYALP